MTPDDGTPTVDCFTPIPIPASNLWGGLRLDVEEASGRNRRGASDTARSPEDSERIYIRIDLESGNDGTAVIKWLDKKKFEFKHNTSMGTVYAAVPILLIPELAELEGVDQV